MRERTKCGAISPKVSRGKAGVNPPVTAKETSAIRAAVVAAHDAPSVRSISAVLFTFCAF